MKKITFNKDLFLIIDSPDNQNIGFIFNKKDGSIFQVEGITKNIIIELNNKKINEDMLIKKYILKYGLKGKDIEKFKNFLNKVKKNKVIIN